MVLHQMTYKIKLLSFFFQVDEQMICNICANVLALRITKDSGCLSTFNSKYSRNHSELVRIFIKLVTTPVATT